MRSLEDVLKDLNDAEKEYKNKCDKYGIEEKGKRKPKVTQEVATEEKPAEKSEETAEK